jgi:hypothetical protein
MQTPFVPVTTFQPDIRMTNTFEELEIGDSFSTQRRISGDDLHRFAVLTEQPIAEERGRITHSLLLGYISKILGHDFPGHGTVAVAMNTDFLHAPTVDVDVEFTVTIISKNEERGHVRGRVTATSGGRRLLNGEAMLIPPKTEKRSA